MPSFTLRFSTSTSTSMPTSAYRLASSSSSGATIGRRAASSSIAVTLSTSSTANSNPNSRGVNLHSLSRPRAIQCRTLFLGVQHIPILASVDNSNSNTNTSTSSSGNSSSGSVSNTASISASTAGSSSGLRTRSWTPSRGLAQVRTEGFSELWFTASFPVNDKSGRDEGKGLLRTSSDGIEQGQGPGSGKDHKSPDERTLKLGRSKSSSYTSNQLTKHMFCPYTNSSCSNLSLKNPLTPPPKYPNNEPPSRDPLAEYITTPIPIDASAPARGQGASSIPSCALDCACGVGFGPYCREREIGDCE